MPRGNLGLNEAILVVNRVNLTSPLEVLYRTNECYGCPLAKLKTLVPAGGNSDGQQDKDAERQEFTVSTRFSFQLELRQPTEDSDPNNISESSGCRLEDVSLNSQGQYRLDVSPKSSGDLAGARPALLCSLKTIDSGECLLCPFAILACILCALIGFEQFYTKFWLPKRQQRAHYSRAAADRKLSSPGMIADASREAGGQAVDCNSTNSSSGGSGDQDQEQGHEASTVAAAASGATDGTDSRAATATLSNGSKFVSRRIECLDVFRGLTLAGMILVNYGGAGYRMLEHTPWDGITPADFVFPFFVFSMGASVAISVRSLVKRYPKSFKRIATKIVRRAAVLALIGVCLNSKWVNYKQPDGLSKLRLTGVLQRFSVSYLVVAFMYAIELMLAKWIRAQSLSQVPYLSKLISIIFELLTAFNYAAIYVYFTFFFEYDSQRGECPAGYIGPGGQTEGGRYASCTGGAAAWLDRTILGTSHIYQDREVKEIFMTQVSHDPEGILGYTTSILLALVGLQCGKILIGSKTSKRKLLALGQWTIALVLASSLVMVIPINKRLWSLTFVIVTALAAFLTITLLYLLIDIYACKRSFILRLFSSAGKNSIFLYVGHSMISGMLPWWFPISDQSSHLQLLLRLSWSVHVWLLAAHYMALKGLFIRI